MILTYEYCALKDDFFFVYGILDNDFDALGRQVKLIPFSIILIHLETADKKMSLSKRSSSRHH